MYTLSYLCLVNINIPPIIFYFMANLNMTGLNLFKYIINTQAVEVECHLAHKLVLNKISCIGAFNCSVESTIFLIFIFIKVLLILIKRLLENIRNESSEGLLK